MKNKKGIIVFTVIVITSLFLFTGCKQQHGKSAFIMDYISESLDLTAEQEAALDDIRNEVFTKMKEMRGEKGEFCTLIKDQLASENIDKEFIHQAITEHREKKDIVINLAVDKLIDFHGQLTPVQRAKLVAKFDKFSKHHSQRWME